METKHRPEWSHIVSRIPTRTRTGWRTFDILCAKCGRFCNMVSIGRNSYIRHNAKRKGLGK